MSKNILGPKGKMLIFVWVLVQIDNIRIARNI